MLKTLKKWIFPPKTPNGIKNAKAIQRFLGFSVSPTLGPLPLGQVVVIQACKQYLSPVNQRTRNQAYLARFRRKLAILNSQPTARFPVELWS